MSALLQIIPVILFTKDSLHSAFQETLTKGGNVIAKTINFNMFLFDKMTNGRSWIGFKL